MRGAITLITSDEFLDTCLATVAGRIGADLPGYRGHVYRVFTYAMHILGGAPGWRKPVALALAFHDVGLWTENELAYLAPSEAEAERARLQLAPELDGLLVRNCIHWHHKLTPFHGPDAEVVNAVRRADWIDATGGALRMGLSRGQIAAVTAGIPAPGFQDALMRLAAELPPGGRAAGLMRVLGNVYKF